VESESNRITEREKYCHGCGTIISKETKYCPACGVIQIYISPKKRSRFTAGVLGVLLGGIGAHKFYMGQVGTGILYLLFCWTLLPAVMGLFEGISYLTASDEYFVKRYST